jgi:hypothetical protein
MYVLHVLYVLHILYVLYGVRARYHQSRPAQCRLFQHIHTCLHTHIYMYIYIQYVLDITNADQLSADCFNFFSLMSHPYIQAHMHRIPVVLIFNKIDCMDAHTYDTVIREIIDTFRIDDVMRSDAFNFRCLKVGFCCVLCVVLFI